MTAPRSDDEIRQDLVKRHDPRDVMGWNRRTARLVADVPALLAQRERDTAEIERLRAAVVRIHDAGQEQLAGLRDDLTEAGERAIKRVSDEISERLVMPLIAERDAALARADEAEAALAELRRQLVDINDSGDCGRHAMDPQIEFIDALVGVSTEGPAGEQRDV